MAIAALRASASLSGLLVRPHELLVGLGGEVACPHVSHAVEGSRSPTVPVPAAGTGSGSTAAVASHRPVRPGEAAVGEAFEAESTAVGQYPLSLRSPPGPVQISSNSAIAAPSRADSSLNLPLRRPSEPAGYLHDGRIDSEPAFVFLEPVWC